MIVYRRTAERIQLSPVWRRLRERLENAGGSPAHSFVQDVFLTFGELEAAVADAVDAEGDRQTVLSRPLRRIAVVLGHALCRSWGGSPAGARMWLGRSLTLLHSAERLPLPSAVELSPAEGYAYYGLFPESYIEAAHRFLRTEQPRRAVCLGIRNIGASLSAAVTAALQERGCPAVSFTVRPRGHPFERRLSLEPDFRRELAGFADAHFVVVDEGPGLSGSTMCSVAEALADIGIPDGSIVLFPSWEPDGSGFRSEAARSRWRRHRKYCVGFDELLTAGPVWSTPSRGDLDISAGRWRELLGAPERAWPAAHPQHERRKYLRRSASAGPLLLRFAGLGHYGPPKLRRAQILHEAGFSAAPVGLENGFLLLEFQEGTFLTAEDAGPEFLDQLALYLARITEWFPAGRNVPYDEILEMMRVNSHEVLGDLWSPLEEQLGRLQQVVSSAGTTEIDGRMLPHEWIASGSGYQKTDALDHHEDHFFPGSQDIAWDIAAATVEFRLDPPRQRYLVSRFRGHRRDETLGARLPFYQIAYTAYRLGYSTLAEAALGGTADAERFRRLRAFYSAKLLSLARHRQAPNFRELNS